MRRWTEGIVIVTVMVCLATACGGSGTLSLDPVASAATRTESSGGFHTTLHATFTVLGQRVTMAGSGVMDSSAGTADLDFALSGLPAAAGADGRMTMREIVDSQTVYVRAPLLERKLPEGKHWVRIDLRKVARSAGIDLPEMTGGVDPSQGLKELLGAGHSRKLGTQTVRGVRLTHYHVDVDLTRPSPAVPASDRDKVRKEMQKLVRQTGQNTIPVDAWVDAKGYVRRVSSSSTIRGQGTFAMTADFSDFGAKGSIQAPPSDQTVDLSALGG